MKTKKQQLPEMTLEQYFAGTSKGFQSTIARLAKVAQLTTLEVYKFWREYAASCSSYDQSAVMGEFIEWYKDALGGDRDRLQAAIDDTLTEQEMNNVLTPDDEKCRVYPHITESQARVIPPGMKTQFTESGLLVGMPECEMRADLGTIPANTDGTAGHSKGKWKYNPSTGFLNNGGDAVSQTWSKHEEDFPNAFPNGHLLALAQSAPHDCGDPNCPGVINKRKLELYDKFQAAIHAFLTSRDC